MQVTELPVPLHGIACGQLHLPRHAGLCFGHIGRQVAPAHIGLHYHAPAHAITAYAWRAIDFMHMRHLRQHDAALPVHAPDLQRADGGGGCRRAGVKADLRADDGVVHDHRPNADMAAYRLYRIQYVLHRHVAAGGLRAVDIGHDQRHGAIARRRHVRRPLHARHGGHHPVAQIGQRGQVIAKDRHGDLRAYAGQQVIHAHLHRLAPRIQRVRQFAPQGVVHRGHKPRLRAGGFP